jgi:hypothetical protein
MPPPPIIQQNVKKKEDGLTKPLQSVITNTKKTLNKIKENPSKSVAYAKLRTLNRGFENFLGTIGNTPVPGKNSEKLKDLQEELETYEEELVKDEKGVFFYQLKKGYDLGLKKTEPIQCLIWLLLPSQVESASQSLFSNFADARREYCDSLPSIIGRLFKGEEHKKSIEEELLKVIKQDVTLEGLGLVASKLKGAEADIKRVMSSIKKGSYKASKDDIEVIPASVQVGGQLPGFLKTAVSDVAHYLRGSQVVRPAAATAPGPAAAWRGCGWL